MGVLIDWQHHIDCGDRAVDVSNDRLDEITVSDIRSSRRHKKEPDQFKRAYSSMQTFSFEFQLNRLRFGMDPPVILLPSRLDEFWLIEGTYQGNNLRLLHKVIETNQEKLIRYLFLN